MINVMYTEEYVIFSLISNIVIFLETWERKLQNGEGILL